MDSWKIKSNAESGDGYSNIIIECEEQEIGIIVELKYAEGTAFDKKCMEAMQQIRDRNSDRRRHENHLPLWHFVLQKAL